MKIKAIIAIAGILFSIATYAGSTLPIQGNVITPDNPNIQYIGRINWANKQRPAFNYPGTEIRANFTGTSLKMIARPMSGYFMVKVDDGEAFKVSFNASADSVVTLATALPQGKHTVRICYAIEGLSTHPEFWGFVLDKGCSLTTPAPLPNRRIEFIGNSITCAYGVECTNPNEHFSYATENHFYGYATIVSDSLNAVHTSISRSGIGVYRNYNGNVNGDSVCMPQEFLYTKYGDRTQKWDFKRYQPDVVCINLGTNDFSRGRGDLNLYAGAYLKFVVFLRSVYPKAKIVMITGPQLDESINDYVKQALDQVRLAMRNNGDKDIYRFDFSHQTGSLGYGSDGHPSYLQQQKMAAELIPFLRQITGWK